MKKVTISIAALAAICAMSCKEYGVSIDNNETQAEDTTYVGAVAQAEPKNYLMEELSGVRCGNCPEAAAKLEELNGQNDHRLKVVAIHLGPLAVPIKNHEPKSVQDFNTEQGKKVVQLTFSGDQGNMPCISANRLLLGNGSNKYFIDGASNWPQAIATMKSKDNATPINIKVTSTFNASKDQYDIETTLQYTQAVSGENKLNIFLTENNIKDAFYYSDTPIVYNHVFRKALTDPAGKIILKEYPTKEAGRVYVYRTALKIDASDPAQGHWKPENMKVIVFVSASDVAANDKHVYQVQEIDLK